MSKPETTHDTAGQEPAPRQRKPRKLGPDKWHIWRESDVPEDEPEFQISLHADRDPVSFIERSEDFDAGTYLIKKARANGNIITSSTHTKTERPETALNLGGLEDDDSFESSYLADARTANDLDSASVAKLVAATVNATLEARDRKERAGREQPSGLDIARELEELADKRVERERQRSEEMRSQIAAMMRQNPAQREPAMDAETQASVYFLKQTGALKEMMRATREVISAPEKIDEPPSTTEMIVGLLNTFAPYIMPYVAPKAAEKLSAIIDRVDAGALAQRFTGQQEVGPPTAQQHAPPMIVQPAPQPVATAPAAPSIAESDDEPLTLDLIIENIKTDVLEDNKPTDSINDIVRLAAEQPQHLPVVEQLVSKPTDELLALLSQATNANLTLLANAPKFIEGLKKGVRARLQITAPAAPAHGSNGNAAAKVAATA